MAKYSKLFILVAILMSGVALMPFVGFSSEPFSWERYRGVYDLAADIDMVDFDFVPDTAVIEKDGTVRWTNVGSVDHTATSYGPEFDSGVMAPGAIFTHTFDMTGTYDYRCTLHPDVMTGTIVVADQVHHVYVPLVIKE
jgi:plastocyanin